MSTININDVREEKETENFIGKLLFMKAAKDVLGEEEMFMMAVCFIFDSDNAFLEHANGKKAGLLKAYEEAKKEEKVIPKGFKESTDNQILQLLFKKIRERK